jgi:hypothetical protein
MDQDKPNNRNRNKPRSVIFEKNIFQQQKTAGKKCALGNYDSL